MCNLGNAYFSLTFYGESLGQNDGHFLNKLGYQCIHVSRSSYYQGGVLWDDKHEDTYTYQFNH